MAASNSEESLRAGFATMVQAAEFLAVSRPYLYRLVREERIPTSQIGSQRRIAWTWLYRQVELASGKAPETAEVAS